MASQDELDSLRQELEEWRRRAEVAEAIAAERLARAEAAERAVRGGQAAVPGPAGIGPPTGITSPLPDPPPPPTERRPASLLERWRRYTDSLN